MMRRDGKFLILRKVWAGKIVTRKTKGMIGWPISNSLSKKVSRAGKVPIDVLRSQQFSFGDVKEEVCRNDTVQRIESAHVTKIMELGGCTPTIIATVRSSEEVDE